MNRILAGLFLIFSFCAVAQEKKVEWRYMDNAENTKKKFGETYGALDKSLKYIDAKVKEGDQFKIFRAAMIAKSALGEFTTERALAGDYAKLLEKEAQEKMMSGQVTEKEYDDAITLVKTLKYLADTSTKKIDEKLGQVLEHY